MSEGVDSPLPPLYARWIETLLEAAAPAEPRATCAECAMCAPAAGPRIRAFTYFEPDVKCCSHVPDLPNFLVGRILADPATPEAGRASVEARIDAGVMVTPLGLGMPGPRAVLARHGPEAFGRARALRCPHFVVEGGTCGIHGHRDAVCSTYFCKHVRGATGGALWESVRRLLLVAQADLARWCLAEIGLDDEALARLLANDEPRVDAPALDGRESPAQRRATWGGWAGRERELYGRAAELVEPLAWSDVRRIGGPELALHARIVRSRWRQLVSSDVPRFLRPQPHEVVAMSAGTVTLSAYRATDPLEVSRALYDFLPAFDGRETDAVLAGIERERGFPPTLDHIRELVDFRVLAEAEEERT